MIQKIKSLLGAAKPKKAPTTDFSVFFHTASSAEKKKLLKSVIKEANKDQKDLVDKYKVFKANNGTT